MKKNILIIFVLMSLCVAGITALQLYFSYKNYTAAVSAFTKDSNEALLEAIDSTQYLHRKDVARQFRSWIADTTYAEITSSWDSLKETTVFTLRQVQYPDSVGSIVLTMDQLKGKLAPITPEIKEMFLDEMEGIVLNQLKNGSVLFFTQDLGKRVNDAYFETPVNIEVLKKQYRFALMRRGIDLSFTINGNETGNIKGAGGRYCTGAYNIAVRDTRWIKACFANTDKYLLGQLKWVIAGSLLLIFIMLVCFWYTARTLLSQEKLNRIKDDFINNMTHEIQTPLASILVTAEALKKFDQDEKERDAYIDIILHQGKKLATLADEILEGAKLEKNRLELRDTIELNAFIAQEIKGQHKGVEFIPAQEPVIIKGNSLHLGNALRNLIDNAIKYNTSATPVIIVSVKPAGGGAEISVADNGPGIPDDEKGKVFNQFYRIHSGNVHNIKGYGLGLSYVKKVVTAHKGTISIQDNKPCGTIFIIKLPV